MRQHQQTEEHGVRTRRPPEPTPSPSKPDTGDRSPTGLLGLQRTAGNAAVNRALAQGGPAAVQRMFQAPVQGGAAGQGAGQGLREAQRDRLAIIPAFYVPEEMFGADGSPPPQPTLAYLAPQQPTDAEALGEPMPNLPRPATRRDNGAVLSWEGVFRTEYFVYRIEQINAPGQGVGIDENAGFRIISRVPKRSVDHAKNRTHAFGQRWAPNPPFWARPELGIDVNTPAGRDMAVRVGKGYDLDENELMPIGELPLFRALPAVATQPFIFYVQHLDPKFAHDNRSYLDAAQFDDLAANLPPGFASQEMVGLSVRPQVDRRLGSRQPQQVMGGRSAHEFMGGAGRAGQQGQLSSHEWCHLIGDGDSGPNEFRNLVIGTNAVNTEQLAMETSLRRYVPRLRTLGASIQLRVTALTTDPPSPIPGSGVNPRKAVWISYQIGLVPLGDTDNDTPDVVHRQIMDAERGTISAGEFAFLHALVAEKLRTRAVQLEAVRHAQQAGVAATAGV